MERTAPLEGKATWRYTWGRRVRLWRRNLREFLRELRKHPVAVVALIIIIVYILAAIFAAQITWHDPELRQPARASASAGLAGRRLLGLPVWAPMPRGATSTRASSMAHAYRWRSGSWRWLVSVAVGLALGAARLLPGQV